MTQAIGGPGFLLAVSTTAGDAGTFTTVAEVKDITGPAVSLDVIDVTNQDSPGGFEEIIPTIRRAGEVDFDVNFNPSNATHDGATGLLYLAKNKLKRGWRLHFNDDAGNYVGFDGYVVGFQWKAPVAGVLAATTKIRVTGQPTIVNGPS
jgi:hypothetical protein